MLVGRAERVQGASNRSEGCGVGGRERDKIRYGEIEKIIN